MSGVTPMVLRPPVEPEDATGQVYAEQVRHLYRLAPAGFLGTLAIASIVTYGLWGVVANARLAAWFALVVAITFGRYLVHRAYAAAADCDTACGSWASRFLVGAVAMGCMWGILGAALFPKGSMPHQFLVIFVIGGMVMAAAGALSAVKRVFYGFSLPALVPLILTLFLQGQPIHNLMGVLALVYTAVILAFAAEMRAHILASTRIKFENTGLITRLSAASERIQQSNERLTAEIEVQTRIQEELRQATQRLQALVNASPLAIVVRDANGLIERWNPAAERIFGWTEAEVLHKAIPWYPPGREDEGRRYRNMILRGEAFSGVEAVRLRKDGTPLTVSISGAPILNDKGGATGVLVIITDITARKRFELRQELQAAITGLLAESRTVEEAMVKVIQTFCEKVGWVCGARRVLDTRLNMLRCAEAWGNGAPEVMDFVTDTRALLTPSTSKHAGVARRVWDAGQPLWITDVLEDREMKRRQTASRAGLRTALAFPVMIAEEFYGVMEFFAQGVWQPDSELIEFSRQLGSQIGQFIARKQAEQNLQFVATHDGLTTLPNRMLFGERLSQALAQARRYNRRLALLFIDLDGFKSINDTLGHDAGDALLREIATRLRGCLREGDVIGRIGGDEFVVLIEEYGSAEQLVPVAGKILEAVARPVGVRGHECRVTGSVGISTYPQDGKDSQTLLKNADSAMYRAKEQGKNRYQFYSI